VVIWLALGVSDVGWIDAEQLTWLDLSTGAIPYQNGLDLAEAIRETSQMLACIGRNGLAMSAATEGAAKREQVICHDSPQ
jgi:hypothetical protein